MRRSSVASLGVQEMEHKMGFDYRILVVDDEPIIREVSSAVLSKEGYEVRTADGGFSALAELRRSLPDLIISDLRMPNMSGFELLSVVRRRFPHIPVVAISGEYIGSQPTGLIADAFFTKGHYTPEQLFARIASLIQEAPLRPQLTRPEVAPVWVPRSNSAYVVLICPECLRSSSVPNEPRDAAIQETECIHCGAKICYLASLSA